LSEANVPYIVACFVSMGKQTRRRCGRGIMLP
jgi:hypothetical protein